MDDMSIEERVTRLEQELEDTRTFAKILLSFLVKERHIDFERFSLWRRAHTSTQWADDKERAFSRLHSVLEIEDEAEAWLHNLGAHPDMDDGDPAWWVPKKPA